MFTARLGWGQHQLHKLVVTLFASHEKWSGASICHRLVRINAIMRQHHLHNPAVTILASHEKWGGTIICLRPVRLNAIMRQPDILPIPEMLDAIATSKAAPAALPWRDAPPICKRTVAVMLGAARGWHRSTHWLHHANVRESVVAVLMVENRLHQKAALPLLPEGQPQGDRATAALVPLPTLPPEIWLHCMGFLLRSWWAVRS